MIRSPILTARCVCVCRVPVCRAQYLNQDKELLKRAEPAFKKVAENFSFTKVEQEKKGTKRHWRDFFDKDGVDEGACLRVFVCVRVPSRSRSSHALLCCMRRRAQGVGQAAAHREQRRQQGRRRR